MAAPDRPDRPRGGGRSGVHRRTVLRSTAWSTPVVLAATAAPAFAASTGPLVVSAYKNTLGLQIVLTFTGGDAALPVKITSVTTSVLGITYPIAMSPASGISSTGGKSYGTILSAWVVLTLNYTVTYVFNGKTYTTVVSA